MRVLLSWLNELAPLGDDVDALAAAMTDLGLAVEGIERVGAPRPRQKLQLAHQIERHLVGEPPAGRQGAPQEPAGVIRLGERGTHERELAIRIERHGRLDMQ